MNSTKDAVFYCVKYHPGLTNKIRKFQRIADRDWAINLSSRTANKLTENICSRRLTDSNGKVIVSTAYNDHITTIEWKDENVTMEWDTKGRQLNVDLPESMWKIPDYKKKINMAIE
jgi:hypothetical protein